MHQPMPLKIAVRLFFLCGLTLSCAVHASDFTPIHELLKQNKASQAYPLLVNEEDHHFGEPEYDLLLARAALESGHEHEAIFAYERVLLNQPGNDNARFGLAVAYYRVNENDRAKQLFTEVLAHKPAAAIRQNIRQYLDRIESRQASLRHKLSAQIALRQGWDSNINSATDSTTFELLGASYLLSDESRETADSYSEIVTRLKYNYTLNNNHDLFTHFDYAKRGNHHHRYDTEVSNLRAGSSLLTSYGRLQLPLSCQTVTLDNNRLRTLTAVTASLAGTSKKKFINSYVQYGQIRYPQQSALDVNLLSVGLGYVTTNHTSSVRRLISIYYGNEDAVNEQYKFNGRNYYGVQGKLYIQPAPQHLLEASLLLQNASYNEQHPFFSRVREDQMWSAAVTWSWWLNRQWSVESRLEASQVDSSVNLYDFQRKVISMGINYFL